MLSRVTLFTLFYALFFSLTDKLFLSTDDTNNPGTNNTGGNSCKKWRGIASRCVAEGLEREKELEDCSFLVTFFLSHFLSIRTLAIAIAIATMLYLRFAPRSTCFSSTENDCFIPRWLGSFSSAEKDDTIDYLCPYQCNEDGFRLQGNRPVKSCSWHFRINESYIFEIWLDGVVHFLIRDGPKWIFSGRVPATTW